MKRINFRWNIKFLVASLCLSLFSPISSLFAQTPPDTALRLVTSPLPISLITEPGNTITTELKVKNAGLSTENIKIDILKFRAFEESGAPQILDPEPGDDFVHWVSFSEPTFTLEPEVWKTITATFTVPETASFGYYYAFVFSRVAETNELQDRQTQVVGGTATLVLLEARVPDAKREVTVAEFSTDRRVYEFLPVTFTVKLKNTGNVHVAPRGNIFITKGSEKDIALLEINPGRGNILPNSFRSFSAAWQDGFPVYTQKIEDGKVLRDAAGHPVMQLTWDWQQTSKLRFGQYTAKMLLVYDDGTRDIPIEGTVSFWVVPWRIIIVLAINAAIILGFFYLLWRFFKQRREIMKLQVKEEQK